MLLLTGLNKVIVQGPVVQSSISLINPGLTEMLKNGILGACLLRTVRNWLKCYEVNFKK